MKVFWGMIGALAILTAALLVGGRGDQPRSAANDQSTQPVQPPVQPRAQPPAQPTKVTSNAGEPPESVKPEPISKPDSSPPREPKTPTASIEREPTRSSEPNSTPEIATPESGAELKGEGGGEQPAPAETKTAIPPKDASLEPAEVEDEGTLTPNAPADIVVESTVVEPPSSAELDALVKELQEAAGVGEEQSGDGAADVDQPAPVNSEPLASEPAKEQPAPANSEEPGVEEQPSSSGSANAAPVNAEANEGGEKPAPKPDPTKPEVVPSKFEKREDGSTLVDNRFVMRGTGTKEDPYQVTWDMLVATSELYDPRRDKLKIPERVKMLDGKYVKIVGYVAFPIVAEGPNEMLALLNAWDGCCIGVPPTPYDAVEVRLRENATAEQMLMNWGSITGKFKVEPYLAANWLLGLYLMEDAVLRAEGM